MMIRPVFSTPSKAKTPSGRRQRRPRRHRTPTSTSTPPNPVDNLTTSLQTLILEPLPFLTLPGEIRNNVYKWAWLISRERDESYNIPDFQIHGDVKCGQRGGIRWMNIRSFPLLLVSKRIREEVLPVVSGEAFFEVKTYAREDFEFYDSRFRALLKAVKEGQ